MSEERKFVLFDSRACGGGGNPFREASVLVFCGSEQEARHYAGDFGAMACYSFPTKTASTPGGAPSDTILDSERGTWEWDWWPDSGFSDK